MASPNATQNQSALFLAQRGVDLSDARIKTDILRLIGQYLKEEGFTAASKTLEEEAGVRLTHSDTRQQLLQRMRRHISAGDWTEVEALSTKTFFKTAKAFQYAIYKQQYLELIDKQDYQRAYTLLGKRLKPLEPVGGLAEFKDLCYLLTCKSVHDASSFGHWEGIIPSREALVDQCNTLLDIEGDPSPLAINNGAKGSAPSPPSHLSHRQKGIPLEGHDDTMEREVPAGRLKHLLQQACAFQMEVVRSQTTSEPRVSTLLIDYHPFVVPNCLRLRLDGHTANIKCVDFLGDTGAYILSGGSDNTVRLWDATTGANVGVCSGHVSRVWDVASFSPMSGLVDGSLVASASGDATVAIWDVNLVPVDTDDPRGHPAMTGMLAGETQSEASSTHTGMTLTIGKRSVLRAHRSDVYCVKFHPSGRLVASGGYDKTIRLVDLETSTCLKTLEGHELAVTSLEFHQHGNIVISGSKDRTIRFWDIVSGVCIKTMSSYLGEVTSVTLDSKGRYLLSSSKDNSNRLWDLRMLHSRPIRRYRGHQNTSKNFIRSSFGPNDSMILGGSEDGCVYLWDIDSESVLQTLKGHVGTVYTCRWKSLQSPLVSCSEDAYVMTWGIN